MKSIGKRLAKDGAKASVRAAPGFVGIPDAAPCPVGIPMPAGHAILMNDPLLEASSDSTH